jgi:hypothetical protein
MRRVAVGGTVLIVALGACAAFAQDRAGSRTAPPITIERATYGAEGRFCDARDVVQQRVGGRSRVAIPVDDSLCGDPAPGRNKVVRVSYRCGDNLRQTSSPQGGTLHLNCG